jgi:hypothetical protein
LTDRRTLDSRSRSKSWATYSWIRIVVLARGRSVSHVKLMTSSPIKGTLSLLVVIMTLLDWHRWNSCPWDSNFPVDKIGNFMCVM